MANTNRGHAPRPLPVGDGNVWLKPDVPPLV